MLVKLSGDATITEYDFVLDTTNTQFKLPTNNGLAASEKVTSTGDMIQFANIGHPNYQFYIGTASNTNTVTAYDLSSTPSPGSLNPYAVFSTASTATTGLKVGTNGLNLYYYLGR